MELLFWVFLATGLVLGISYVLMIASYCYGWSRTETALSAEGVLVDVTIIIAARNEERGIVCCLEALMAQNYPHASTQIIVVDDHSTDSTANLLASFCITHPRLKFLKLPEGSAGKKEAMAYAMTQAKGELIITTDADCEMGTDWLSSIVSFYRENKSEMIVGPVAFHKERSIFQKMQSLEFMALIACGGASLFFKKAILCNGANLAFTKKAFDAVKGYEGIDGKASGDDVLLMYKIQELYPGKVRFLKNEAAIIYTEAKETVGEFVRQRKRWASKGFFALNADTKRVSLLVYLFNAWLVVVPLSGLLCFSNSPFHPIFMVICLILIGIKCFIDFLLLFLSASFFKKKGLLLFFIPEWVIYMVYVVVFGLIGPIGKYEWKGRKTN